MSELTVERDPNYCIRCRGHHGKAKRNYANEITAQADADRMTAELKPDWPFEVYRCPLGNLHVGVPKPRFRRPVKSEEQR